MLNDVLPFNHIAARHNDLKLTDHLADGQLPRNNNNSSNLLSSGDASDRVIRHCASVMRNDNPLLLRRPG